MQSRLQAAPVGFDPLVQVAALPDDRVDGLGGHGVVAGVEAGPQVPELAGEVGPLREQTVEGALHRGAQFLWRHGHVSNRGVVQGDEAGTRDRQTPWGACVPDVPNTRQVSDLTGN